MRHGFFLLLLIMCMDVFAQSSSEILQLKASRVAIRSNSNLFSTQDSVSLHEYPKGSGLQMFGFSGFWLGAKDNSGAIHTSIAKNSEDDEFWPGPIDTLTGLAKDPANWDFVWMVSKAVIEDHKSFYDRSGYVVPAAIANWPAKHNSDNVNAYLAPFVDVDQDDIYDPQKGDYPAIKGDFAAYYIANDAYGEHILSGGLRLDVEIHGLLYGFKSGPDTNMLFHEMVIVNRSEMDYDSFYVGRYHELELGNPTDNFIGTWVSDRTVYGFNGDEVDEGGYETENPMVSVVSLDAKMPFSIAFAGQTGIRRFPEDKDEYWNALTGRWSDGGNMTVGGNGTGAGNIARWIYPGTSNPYDPTSWSDSMSGDGPGKRNFLAVYGVYDLPRGGYIEVNNVMLWQTNGNLNLLRSRSQNVLQEFGETLKAAKVVNNSTELWFPNPMNSGGDMSVNQDVVTLEIVDMTGKTVEKHKNDKKIPWSCSIKQPSGVYWVKATTTSGTQWKKMLVY